jgi:energy-converting hydrogenase Eha subunit E
MNKLYVKEFLKLFWKRYLFLTISVCFSIFLIFYTKAMSLLLFFIAVMSSFIYILIRDIKMFIKKKEEEE